MSTGHIGIIAGSRALSRLRRELADDLDEILSVFTLIDSETDHLPIGDIRAHLAADALAAKDQEIAHAEQIYEDMALSAARALREKLLETEWGPRIPGKFCAIPCSLRG